MTEAPAEETILQQGKVTVTTARAILGAKTYAMSNITSVSLGKNPANKAPGVVILLIGAAIGLCSIGAFDSKGTGLFFIGAGLLIGIPILLSAKDKYVVRIGSASGETDALGSEDEQKIRNIVKAINDAIVKRG